MYAVRGADHRELEYLACKNNLICAKSWPRHRPSAKGVRLQDMLFDITAFYEQRYQLETLQHRLRYLL